MNTQAEHHHEPDPSTQVTQPHIVRVMLVDDAVDFGEIVVAALERANILTIHVKTGNEARQKYELFRPDAVLLDLNLPDMTGWELLDWIREHKKKTNRPAILVLTAFGDPANRLMGRLRDVENFLTKPIAGDKIIIAINEALAKAEKRATHTGLPRAEPSQSREKSPRPETREVEKHLVEPQTGVDKRQ